jgi:DNA end-binding protein Ku
MRSMKKTSLSFGLVNIPIRLYKATEDHDVGFHQHHDADLGRIGYQKYCKDCGKVVDKDNIVKGIDYEGHVIVVTEDELSSLAEEVGPQIEVVQFAEAHEIDAIAYENAYYAEPDGATEGYALLREVLGETDRIAVVRFTLRGDKTHLGVLRVKDGLLVIHSMRWPDEVRNPSSLKVELDAVVKPQALKMAHMLVESMLMEFKPTEYVDNYTARIEELIEAKAEGHALKPKPQELDNVEEVADIIAQLEASIKRHPAGKAKARKPAPRKAPARRKKIA